MFTLLQCIFQQRNVRLSFQMYASVSSADIKQYRYCTYNVTLRCVRATIVAVEKVMIITQLACVFVTLDIQHAMRMCHTLICGLPHSPFFHIISLTTCFSGGGGEII
jgi:hypothetical protein